MLLLGVNLEEKSCLRAHTEVNFYPRRIPFSEYNYLFARSFNYQW